MEIKKREIILFYSITALLGVWFVWKVIFVSFHEKLAGFNKEAILEEARLKKGLSLVEKKDNIEKEYGKYATYFAFQNASDEEVVASFLKEIEEISRTSGLMILDMKPQKETKTDKFSKQYQINIKAESGMKEFVKFLYALHESSILFSVEKINLVPKSEESANLSISMTIVGVVFL